MENTKVLMSNRCFNVNENDPWQMINERMSMFRKKIRGVEDAKRNSRRIRRWRTSQPWRRIRRSGARIPATATTRRTRSCRRIRARAAPRRTPRARVAQSRSTRRMSSSARNSIAPINRVSIWRISNSRRSSTRTNQRMTRRFSCLLPAASCS